MTGRSDDAAVSLGDDPTGRPDRAPGGPGSTGHERGRALRPLRERDFALLWSGQTVSLLGDGVFTVALALEALHLSRSPSALAYVLAARALPMVLFLFVSGAVTDRLPRRAILLASDVVRGIAVAVVAVLTATHALQVSELVVMSAVFGCADAFFMPAATAIVPELVPVELLNQASALESSSWVAAQSLVGPALGGLIVAVAGIAASFAVDAASFGVSAACLVWMQRRPAPKASGGSMLHDIRAGIAYVRSQRWLWGAIVAASVANFAGYGPASVLVPLLVRRVLHAGPAELGLVLAAGGLGGLVGTFLVGRFGPPRRRITVMWLCWCLSSVALIGIGLSPALWMVGLFSAIGWGLLLYGGTLWNPIMQQLVPSELLGRASAVDWLVSLSLMPVGILLAGVAATEFGARTTLVACGVIAVLPVIILFVPGVRDPERSGALSP